MSLAKLNLVATSRMLYSYLNDSERKVFLESVGMDNFEDVMNAFMASNSVDKHVNEFCGKNNNETKEEEVEEVVEEAVVEEPKKKGKGKKEEPVEELHEVEVEEPKKKGKGKKEEPVEEEPKKKGKGKKEPEPEPEEVKEVKEEEPEPVKETKSKNKKPKEEVEEVEEEVEEVEAEEVEEEEKAVEEEPLTEKQELYAVMCSRFPNSFPAEETAEKVKADTDRFIERVQNFLWARTNGDRGSEPMDVDKVEALFEKYGSVKKDELSSVAKKLK